jgi:alpha-galactosidase/6-phospho-beta-glucosidase family protein
MINKKIEDMVKTIALYDIDAKRLEESEDIVY